MDKRAVAVIAAFDVRAPGSDKTAGGLVLGRWIDYLAVERVTNLVRPARVSLIGDGAVVASTLPDEISSGLVSAAVNSRLAAGDTISERQELGDGAYFSAFTPLTTDNGEEVAILALTSPDTVIARTREDVTRSLFLISMVVGFIALGLAWLSGRRISRPIQNLTRTATEIREGNLDARAAVGGNDEVGRLGDTFNEMTSALLSMAGDLRASAKEEESLRSRIEAIIQSMADGLVAVDADRKVLAFNIEAELMTGLKAEDAIGKPIDEVIEVLDPQGEPTGLPIFELAEGSVGDVFLTRSFGAPLPVAVTCAVLRSEDDGTAGGVAVIRDMTGEREFERMKSEFLANISHELRTPLTPIKGYAEILGRKELPFERSKRFAGGILESTQKLERIVELLVDFSAMEAGRLSPKSNPVSLDEVIGGLIERWREISPRHGFEILIPEGIAPIAGDERLLRRSLEEIIDNAVKFSPDGGAIQISALHQDGGPETRRDSIVIKIMDEGIGIPEEDVPRIFSDFHQLDGSETRSYGGLGLGLAFVRRIVEAHSGTISVESAIDVGTTFTVILPEFVARGADGED